MPEGPEIRRAADEVAAAIAGKNTEEVWFAFDHLQPFADALRGERVTAVTSRSKAMITRFANGLNIYSHNQLYGKWVVRPAYDLPDTNRQLRLAIHNHTHSALLYSASEIEVLSDAELAEQPYLRKLGPELLDEEVTVQEVATRFVDGRFHNRRLTTLLLDQGFLAGMGNYLRSEVLFVARVSPTLRPADCTPEQIQRLAEAAVSLTRQSYRTKGITNDPQLVEKLKAQGWRRRDYRFWVFDRDGQPCHHCGTPILKETLGGRRCYYCPNCLRTETSKQ